MARGTNLVWAGFVVVCGAAVAIAATAPRPPYARRLNDEERRAVFAQFAIDEARMRKQAEHDWPTDPWSQDDAFHNLALHRAEDLAGQRKTRPAEIFRAQDDGMRERWPRAPSAVMRATVPPCRPRPITD